MKIDNANFSTGITELSVNEIEQVDGAELTAREVAEIGLVAIALSPFFGPAGPAVAAAGATAAYLGGAIAAIEAD
ncbi:MAG: hypothetical protein GW858_10795 [Sphingomonadales bacterium]|nr:hypothetical protein [Sphingomonadales bacterium]NCQ22196.1 hypothetical protein [Sphingomonadales bacterium]NCT03554.1 hypothetical protein [Sphingomonadales bacterium]